MIIGILAALVIVAYNGIQDRARTAAAMSHAAQIKRGPDMENATFYYQFDQGSGSSVVDASDKNNTGTVIGTANYSADTPTRTGRSFSFNGSSRITTSIPLQASYYLKSAWVKPTGCSNIVSATSGGSDAFYLPGCRMNAGHNGLWGQVADTTTINDGKWHFIVAEYQQADATNGTLKLWRDGSLVATNTAVSLPSGISATTPQVGAFGAGNFYTGLMDDVIVITK